MQAEDEEDSTSLSTLGGILEASKSPIGGGEDHVKRDFDLLGENGDWGFKKRELGFWTLGFQEESKKKNPRRRRRKKKNNEKP